MLIFICGLTITKVADVLARETGLGQALMGAVFLGGTTSFSGMVTCVTAARRVGVGNAIGGIAVQTAFFAIADMAYHKANLEHAAASEANLLQGTLLVTLLALLLLTMTGPAISVCSVHPATLVIFMAYALGSIFFYWLCLFC